jgi:Zn-dependent protease with chaperone function
VDFFDSQDVARRKTGRLVVLFVIAVIAIIAVTYLLVAGVLVAYSAKQDPDAIVSIWDARLLLGVGISTLLIVGLGSAYKLKQLQGGGPAIAEHLGGKLLHGGNATGREKVLLNVVDEMAIASGTPVPLTYLMPDEEGINAFAAGFTPDDAVVGITRGALEQLDREQLQGVIAHEFSHILNGDMRLNMRLMGALHGILLIALLGRTVLYSMRFSGGRSRRSGSGGGNGAAMVLAIAFGLMVIGFMGLFFGNLIKAAVSRQREYLADASSVQFTRNPDGISGALKTIGGYNRGSVMAGPNAAEASHMYFANGLKSGLASLTATHPPLEQRVLRVDPGWDGTWPVIEGDGQRASQKSKVKRAERVAQAGARDREQAAQRGKQMVTTMTALQAALALAGRPTPAHVSYARELVASLPEAVRDAVREPFGARAVIYALLLDTDPDIVSLQLARLDSAAEPGVADQTLGLRADVAALDARARLPLVDMALPALRSLSETQFAGFSGNLDALIAADERVDLFEWSLRRILLHQTAAGGGDPPRHRVRYYALGKRLTEPCEVLLSALAHAGHDERSVVEDAFAQASRQLTQGEPADRMALRLREPEEAEGGALDRALDVLVETSPKVKRAILNACAVCIGADREVTVSEAELFRAVAGGLGCPIPPVLPGQPLA